MIKICPRSGWIVAITPSAEEITKSGLIIPEAAQKKRETLEIVAIPKEESEFSVGQIILTKRYSGTEFEVDEVKYLVVPVEDIVAVMDN